MFDFYPGLPHIYSLIEGDPCLASVSYVKGDLLNLVLTRWLTVLVNRMWHRHGWSWSCCTVALTLSVPDLGLCRLKCHPDIQLVVDCQMYRFVKCTVVSCTLQLVFFHYGYFERKHTSGLVSRHIFDCYEDRIYLFLSVCQLFAVQNCYKSCQGFINYSLYKFFVWFVWCQHWHNSHHNHFTCAAFALSSWHCQWITHPWWSWQGICHRE